MEEEEELQRAVLVIVRYHRLHNIVLEIKWMLCLVHVKPIAEQTVLVA
jgi:hypothetical protein